MATTTTASKFLGLDVSDFLKGALVAAITTPITLILDSLNSGSLTFDWRHIGAVALAGFLSYVVKNFLSPASVTIKGVDSATVDAVKEGEKTVKIVPTTTTPVK